MKGLKIILTIFMFVALTSCSESQFKEGKVFAGGVRVSAQQLNDGKSAYAEYCIQCHGATGEGNGVAAKGLEVPPRNLKLGIYKFGRVIADELPHDDDFYKILKHGLNGTVMLPWDLSDKQIFNVTQYIKTFAPETWVGADKKLGTKVVAGKDPYGEALKESAIEKGKAVYHVKGRCFACHQAYVSHAELNQLQKANSADVTEYDPDIYHVKLMASDYDYKTMPPEFTYDLVRSAKTVEELYVRIGAGVGGTAMASWKGRLSEEELWALAYYVRSLMDLRNTWERKALFEEIKK